LEHWLRSAVKGDKFIYHTGHLAPDRGFASHKILSIDNPAKEAWEAMENRLVRLVQRRVGNRFEYLMVRV